MLKLRGFTLLELMIVMAVIAILAAIGYPSYADYVRRGRITEAVSTLSSLRVQMEQWFQDNRTYAGGPCTAVTLTPSFTVSCPAPTASAYTITATGTGTMTGFTYTVNEAAVKATPFLPAGWHNQNCGWVLKKDGSC